MDVALPQCQHPVINLERCRYRDNQCRGGEKETEIRVHAADIHVMRPNDKAQAADRQDRPDHHAVAEYILSGMC